MKIDDSLIEKLERYLMDSMNLEERTLFQKEINNSEDLQEFIEIYNQIDNFEDDSKWNMYRGNNKKLKHAASLFNNKETLEFSQKLKDFKNNYSSKTPTKKLSWKNIAMYSSVAASILFMFYTVFFQTQSLNDIYKQHNTWNELPSLSVKGETTANKKAKLEKLFLSKDYNATIKLAKKLIANSKNTEPNILLYLGISQMEINKHKEAIKTFDVLINSNTIDNHKGYWYKAMVYLKTDDKINAKKVFQKIVANDYFKKKQASKILKKLN